MADIVRAASVEFEEKGYAGATMRDVVERSGTSLSVTHRHFPTKARLFAAALVVPFAEFLREFGEEWAGRTSQDDESLMREFVGELYRQLDRHRTAIEGLVGCGEAARAEVLAAARDSLAEVFLRLDEIGREAAGERGWLSEDSAMRGERMATLLVVGAILTRDLIPGLAGDGGEALVEDIAQFVLYGIHQSENA